MTTMTPAKFEVNISCNDFFNGVSCCSNNRRRVVYQDGVLKKERKRIFRHQNSGQLKAENVEARKHFNIYLNEHFKMGAHAVCSLCDGQSWSERVKGQYPLTTHEIRYLIDLAESIPPEQRTALTEGRCAGG